MKVKNCSRFLRADFLTPKRRDIKEILEKYEMTEYDPYELLKRNGGRLPIDNYEFICPIL